MALNLSNNGFSSQFPHFYRGKQIIRRILASCLFLMLLMSCRKKDEILFSEFIQFNNAEMISDENYVIATDIIDSLILENPSSKSYILVRYTDLCDVSRIPLEVEFTSADSRVETLDIELPLFKESNSDSGETRDAFGIYESKIPLPFTPDYRSGGYISLSSPQNDIKGILALGLIIVKNNISSSNHETDKR